MQIMVGFSFFSSMLLTNDVAILTLVPLYLTIAANLGSAVTPFGNPQNIYLVANYHLSLLSFFSIDLDFISCKFYNTHTQYVLFQKKTTY